MNKAVVFIFIYFVATLSYAQDNKANYQFNLHCQITGQDTGTIIIHYRDRYDKLIHDTGIVKNNHVLFTGEISQPTSVWMQGNIKSFSASDSNNTDLFIERGEVYITLKRNEFKKAMIEGSVTQKEFDILQSKKAKIFQERLPLEKEFEKVREALRKDSENKALIKIIDSLRKGFEPYNNELRRIDYEYIATHSNSFVSPYLMLLYLRILPFDSVRYFYNSFHPSIQSSRDGKTILNAINKIERNKVGNKAPDFSSTDINGNKINLSSLKGTYVLLYFWATWCVPCRQSSPHLIDLYNTYHSKGLQIISIANDDNNKEGWKNAIKKDGTFKWYQILQGVDFEKMQNEDSNENDIGEMYGVEEIPVKVLINKEGIIIGRYKENFIELDKKLSEIFQD